MAKLCMGCMNPLPEGHVTCSVCGYDPAKDQNPEHCLPVTTSLQGHYIVGRLMGVGSDHLLYLGYDRQLREPCFIQEFFPGAICRRDTIGGVQPTEGNERAFEEYAAQFRQMMRTLARMRDLPAIVPVFDIFEENGTVYAVSDYCQGMTLSKKIKLAGGRIPWSEARTMFMPLAYALTNLNDAGICHLALCPDNILIGSDGKARLRCFSIPAVHQAGSGLALDLRDGYAAPEQYREGVQLGATADVYGLAATLFRSVTGNELPVGNRRAKSSDDLFMSAEAAEELGQPVCVALFNALQVSPENRTASMAELRDQLALTPKVSALVTEVEEDIQRDEAASKKRKKGGMVLGGTLTAVAGAGVIGALLLVVLIVLLILPAIKSCNGGDEGASTTTTTNTAPTLATTTVPTADDGAAKAVVDNVLGRSYYDLRDGKLGGDMTLVLDSVAFSDKAAGTILSQSPAAGEEVEKGTEVRVVISLGREGEEVKVPNVSGWKQEHAVAYLEALGFRVNVVKLKESNQEKGYVDSTDPKAGTVKRMGDTIDLRVSDVAPTTTTTQAPVEEPDNSTQVEEQPAE